MDTEERTIDSFVLCRKLGVVIGIFRSLLQKYVQRPLARWAFVRLSRRTPIFWLFFFLVQHRCAACVDVRDDRRPDRPGIYRDISPRDAVRESLGYRAPLTDGFSLGP